MKNSNEFNRAVEPAINHITQNVVNPTVVNFTLYAELLKGSINDFIDGLEKVPHLSETLKVKMLLREINRIDAALKDVRTLDKAARDTT